MKDIYEELNEWHLIILLRIIKRLYDAGEHSAISIIEETMHDMAIEEKAKLDALNRDVC